MGRKALNILVTNTQFREKAAAIERRRGASDRC